MTRTLLAVIVAGLSVGTFTSSGCEGTTTETPDRSAIPVDVSLRFRRSCNGTEQQNYDTSCLAAVRMVAKTEGKTIVRCTVLDDRPDNLREFIRSAVPYVSFGTFTDRGSMTLALQGLHDVTPLADGGVRDPCTDAENESTWLFFGESAPFDLADFANPDAGPRTIDIPVDCRDCTNGCETLGQPVCPVNRTSFCVPAPENLTCEKPCANDESCFQEALSCDVERGRCDQETAEVGAFCSACASDLDCDAELEYFCVGVPGATTGLCAKTCPQSQCLNGAICRQLFHNLVRLENTPLVDAGIDDAGIDGGP